MKLSAAIVALSALPSVMGQLDESCFFMPVPESGGRRLDGIEGFFDNPGADGFPLVDGDVTLSCDDHDGLITAGFVKYTAAQVCANFLNVGGISIEAVQCANPALPWQCQGPSGACSYDINWTCKEHFSEEDSNYIKGIHCGQTAPCKENLAICALDPHFKTWADDNSWYDFHGQCDLKYMSDPNFGMGIGMEIDIRTKGRYEYSYIESVAVKLGDDVFEFSSFGNIHYNGVESAKVDGVKMAGLFLIEQTKNDKKHQAYTINIRGKESIEVSSFKDMVSVKVMHATEKTFGTTVGLMGDFQEGKLTSRDGKRVYSIKDQEEMNAFGQEWQIRASEPNLFQTPGDPSQKCVMPSKTASTERKRRLGENVISEEVARAACATAKTSNMEMCVHDVIATADLELASVGVY